ncbi:dihydroneopterin aldolase [Arenibacter nanhaiticus]|uniref:7,8-dihydroneopterin aldolase n=1 Tax=Arenibacter nanhaiticus TaxID=558155 RepID=A0A1M6MW70_9FLAO|nr:dihydroneopterin aldolase [Arenibacter nanhaiticus]SHJ87748.1 dihydroneopterin aldolase [Arenibacter nanhaiticus]
MGKVEVSNIRVYAHHGCLKEETIIGSDYRVDVAVKASLQKAAKSDQLVHTVDYVLINHIVKEEMKVPSKLLEHVAERIIKRIFKESKMVRTAKVAVTKINPPIGGDVAEVTVTLKSKR